MKYLFIHNNFPAQFVHMAKELVQRGDEVIFLSNFQRKDLAQEGIKLIIVPSVKINAEQVKSESHRTSQEIFLTGEAFGATMLKIRKEGFVPDAIYAHAGWGGAIYVPDIFPEAAYIAYCEWFYTKGEHYHFFHREQQKPSNFASNRQRNLYQLDALRECDVAISPTFWQQSQYPTEFMSKINVIHDGIDMDFFLPDRETDGIVQGVDLSQFPEIVTYATRGMEPYRGFPQFCKSIPQILAERPDCHVVIMGKDKSHYSAQRSDGKTWLEAMRQEMPFDSGRVHILNFGTYEEYRKVLRFSTVHVYLTAPFVLSWSMLEAMSCGCLVVASATSPVQEVLRHEHNGFLTSFWDSSKIAETVSHVLEHAKECGNICSNARKTIEERYNLKRNVSVQFNIIQAAIGKRKIYTTLNTILNEKQS